MDARVRGHDVTITSAFGFLALVVALAATGCASYAPLPLDDARAPASVTELTVPVAALPLPELRAHRFDPSDGLDVTEVAMLAVSNNPDLKVKRDELGLARAQAFAAGLLPDPQISAGLDFPTHSPTPDVSSAFTFGLSEDVAALLTRSARHAAARADAEQVNLDLLWAEWQTVAQARLLFGEVVALRAVEARLAPEQAALLPLAEEVRAALDAGNLTYELASAGLTASADVVQKRAANALALHQAEAALRTLLGLAATASLELVGAPYTAAPAAAEVTAALAELPRRRPDLLALQAGYHAQEERLRAAILAQFPALTLGATSARDTSAVYTQGFSFSLNLPLFDRNRGHIAIETTTRQRLKDDYAARVLATRADVQRLLADLATLDRQHAAATARAAQLDSARRAAEPAWDQGLLDWPTYLAIRTNALGADLDVINAEQERSRSAIALEALLGRSDFTFPGTSQ